MPPLSATSTDRPRVMFLYWGRRGALARMTLDLAEAAAHDADLQASFCVSRQSDTFAPLAALGVPMFALDTFASYAGAVGKAWRIPGLRRRLVDRLRSQRVDAVVELIPHVWSPFVMPAIRAAGVRYATIVHETEPHLGDYKTAWAIPLVLRAVRTADVVLTLSRAVADRIVETAQVPRARVATLFHPDLGYGANAPLTRLRAPSGAPLRLLFLGRILPYKGLPVFVEAIERARAQGIDVAAGVFGEGDLGGSARRLAALGAEVVNRWLGEHEIPGILARYDVMVLSHTHASQSGVAAAAFGARMPVLTTPVGGLAEQVAADGGGLVAARADADALAAEIVRLVREPGLYEGLCRNLTAGAAARSPASFVRACVRAVCDRQL